MRQIKKREKKFTTEKKNKQEKYMFKRYVQKTGHTDGSRMWGKEEISEGRGGL